MSNSTDNEMCYECGYFTLRGILNYIQSENYYLCDSCNKKKGVPPVLEPAHSKEPLALSLEELLVHLGEQSYSLTFMGNSWWVVPEEGTPYNEASGATPWEAASEAFGREFHPKTCVWNETVIGWWETSCGQTWDVSADTPVESGIVYCSSCGLRVTDKP